MNGAWLLLAVLAEPPRLLTVRAEVVEARPALTLVLSAPPSEVQLQRVGEGFVLSLAAVAARPLALPSPPPPVESLGLEEGGGRVRLRVGLPAATVPELRRRGGLVSLLLHGPEPEATPQAAPDVQELYPRLFPPPMDVPVAEPAEADEGEPSALQLGRVSIRPAADIIYVDAESALLETPEPVHEDYVELRPRVVLESPLAEGWIKGGYEARIRRGTGLELLRAVTHVADLQGELPVGSLLRLRASEHFARGTLETREVDPGREYFFNLARFTHHDLGAGATLELSRTALEITGRVAAVDLEDEERAGFFSYRSRSAGAAVRYALSPVLDASAGYTYDRVPPPARRPLAEFRAHSAWTELRGEPLPLVRGWMRLGYRDHHSPRAPREGRRFRGLLLSAQIAKEFTPATTLTVAASRGTHLSAFESNAFYVASEVGARLTTALPLSLSMQASGTYHWNRYLTAAAEASLRRRDTIRGWSVGVGRSFARRLYARVDYREERRDSNLDRFDTRSRAFTAQLGLGLFGRS